MRPLVVDASVALRLVRPEPGLADASAVIAERAAAGLMVPPLFWLEIVNVLARRDGYSGAAIVEAIHELEETGIRTIEADRSGVLAVIDLVERHGLTAYDAAYLALAHAADADLATADRGLALAAGDRALYIGPERGIAGERAAYRPREATWPAWPEAGAYLARLRASVDL